MTNRAALASRTFSGFAGWVLGSAASAPMVVLVGGIVGTYAASQLVALPLMFVLVGAVVWLLSVGYTAMAREVPHAAAYYAILAQGLGRGAGVAGGMVALLCYNAIQISLYGLLGALVAGLAGGSWWVWALLAVALVGFLGVRRIAVSTWVMAVVLCASLLVIVLFVAAAVVEPAQGLRWSGFDVGGLFAGGAGAAAALTMAAFVGVETPASHGEEVVDEQVVTRSVRAGIVSLAVLYAVAAFAMGVAVGPDQVAAVAADPAGGLPFAVLDRMGSVMTPVAQLVLVLAILTSAVAFHGVIARYVLGIAGESVLPSRLAHSTSRTRVGAPVGGSVLQSVIAAATIVGFAVMGADPQATMFAWLSTLGAMGLLALLVAASLAARYHFYRLEPGQRPGGWWTAVAAPLAGVLCGLVVLVLIILNAGTQLGTAPGSWAPWLLPAAVLGAAVGGGMWAAWLRRNRPEVYAGIGGGSPDPYSVPDAIDLRF
ncbi:APC family permease [Actinoplanes sp. NPDC051859]|uniref:APC family permease n=1 Tax=Actinoplanes sp. NPDC051859 TaxID=3363909 RepID=UPI003796BF34